MYYYCNDVIKYSGRTYTNNVYNIGKIFGAHHELIGELRMFIQL